MNLETLIKLIKCGSFENQNIRVSLFDKDKRVVYISNTIAGLDEHFEGRNIIDYYKSILNPKEVEKTSVGIDLALDGKVSKSELTITNPVTNNIDEWDVEFNPVSTSDGKKYVMTISRLKNRPLEEVSTGQFLRRIVERSSDVFTVFDENFNFVYISRQLEGWRDTSVIGCHVSKLAKGEVYEIFKKRCEHAKSSPGKIYTEVYEMERRGQLYTLESTMEYYDFDHLGCFYLDLTRDITSKRKRELEVEEQKNLINKMTNWSALGQMAANIAHEVNNPLAILDLQVHSLRRKGHSLDIDLVLEKLDSIADQSQRIADIVSTLRTYTRDGAATSEKHRIEVKKIVENSIVLFKTGLLNKQFEVDLINSAQDVDIKVNSSEFIQVLINLLNNAYDAIADSPEKWIQVKVYKERKKLKIDVVDSGPGIEKDIQDKIFDQFFTTKSRDKGTGLGLNICKQLISSQGGSLIYDASKENTTFTISLDSY